MDRPKIRSTCWDSWPPGCSVETTPRRPSKSLSPQCKATPAPLILDVRTPVEFNAGHIRGAVNRPLDSLRGMLDELPRERPIVTYCEVGQRGYLATRILLQRGFSVVNLGGGFNTFKAYQATGVLKSDLSETASVAPNGEEQRTCGCGKCNSTT